MPYRIPNKAVIDTNARKAVGVSIPFSAPGVFVSTYTTKDQLKSNILNYFMTDPGERYLNVQFGFGIRRVLFEQLADATYGELKARIESDMRLYFPTVQVANLKVAPYEFKPNTLQIQLSYSVPSFGITEDLNFTVTQP
jgi:phage baseplate assembly protein W